MDWRSRSTRKLLGKVVTVQVDRPVGYLHGDILYPINYGFVPGLMGGDGEEQDAYILGVDTPLSDFTGRVIAVIRRHNDCEDKLVVAPEGLSFHQGQIAEAVHFQEQYFISTIDSIFQKSCGVVPFRRAGVEPEFLLLFQRGSGTWSLSQGSHGGRGNGAANRPPGAFRGNRLPDAADSRRQSRYGIPPQLRRQKAGRFLPGRGSRRAETPGQGNRILPLGSARRTGTISSAPGRKRRKSAACPDIKRLSTVHRPKLTDERIF